MGLLSNDEGLTQATNVLPAPTSPMPMEPTVTITPIANSPTPTETNIPILPTDTQTPTPMPSETTTILPISTNEDASTPTKESIDNQTIQSATRLEIDGVLASSQWSTGYAGYRVDDGRLGSYWATQNGRTAGETLLLMFREEKVVSEIGFFTPENVQGSLIRLATLTFANGSSQTVSLENHSGWEYIQIQPTQTDSIQITVDGVNPVKSPSYVSVYEIQLFGVDLEIEPIIENTKQIPVSVANGSSEWSSSYNGMRAIDNGTSSYWATKSGDTRGTVLTLELEEPRTISFIGLYRPIAGEGQPVKKATLVFSDGSVQTIEFRGLFDWEYVQIEPVLTSHIDMIIEETFSNPNGDTYSAIYELQLFGE